MTDNKTDNHREMHEAVKAGNVARILELLTVGTSPDVKEIPPFGRTPLYNATAEGQTEAVRILLEAGASVEARYSGDPPIITKAAWENQTEIIKLLLAHGATVYDKDKGFHALKGAALSGSLEALELLLPPTLACVQAKEIVRAALNIAACGNATILNRLLPVVKRIYTVDGQRETLLEALCHSVSTYRTATVPYEERDAMYRRRLECAQALVKAGADVNGWYSSSEITHGEKLRPIHLAAQADVRLLDFLLKEGADFESITENRHNTILHFAAKSEKPDCLIRILSINPDFKSVVNIDGDSALHVAATYHGPQKVRALIERGINPNIRNNDSRAPMDSAISSVTVTGHSPPGPTVEALLEGGATIEKERGAECLHLAGFYGEKELFSLLLDQGVPVDACYTPPPPKWQGQNRPFEDNVKESAFSYPKSPVTLNAYLSDICRQITAWQEHGHPIDALVKDSKPTRTLLRWSGAKLLPELFTEHYWKGREASALELRDNILKSLPGASRGLFDMVDFAPFERAEGARKKHHERKFEDLLKKRGGSASTPGGNL